jgi:hypothetical protein
MAAGFHWWADPTGIDLAFHLSDMTEGDDSR